ncbi:hypothetical protein HY772_06195 [Candidatus Woesearchaeota archaeon]|nr:hypothetical protein [Candidatus Woesearchaeota archaeon]
MKEYFWSRVNKCGKNGCWEWQGTMQNGTPVIWYQYKCMSARQYSLRLAYGENVPQVSRRRRCTNEKCVRPSHLVEQKDEKINLDRLSREEVLAVMYLADKYKTQLNVRALAAHMKKGHSAVWYIVHHYSHKKVELPVGYRLPARYEKVPGFLRRRFVPQAISDDQRKMLLDKINRCKTLTDRERLALRARYGLDDHPPLKFSEIAREMRLTENAAWGLVRRAWNKVEKVR